MPLLEVLLDMPYFIAFIAILVIIFIKKNIDYRNCAYYKVTRNSYLSIMRNKGLYGEYLIYKQLKEMEADGAKFLFNIYIPKENGETTEIDVLMISSKGIFVFESKNYSGWIFGEENQKGWYQTLPVNRGKCHKERFYNPIMQNDTHIKYLKGFLGEDVPTKSMIVFSDRCTLKKLQIHSRDIIVINRKQVVSTVASIYHQMPGELLDENCIKKIYNQLYPCTQVDETVKKQHIANFYNKEQGNGRTDVLFGDIFSKRTTRTTNLITKESGGDEVHSSKDQLIQKERRCPICSGKLVVRTATKGKHVGGQFYGCSNYPKCGYIENISK